MLSGRLNQGQQRTGIGVVGKIKVGVKNENGYPQSLDYFRPDAPATYEKMFHDSCGDRPNRIQVIFISDDITHACNVQEELRDKSGKLYAKGDGNTYAIVGKSGDWVYLTKGEIEAKYGSLDAFYDKSAKHCQSQTGWKTRLTMRFLIPQIQGLLGEWQLSTNAVKSSIQQIISCFDLVKEMAGTVINAPFDLTVEKVKSDRHGVSRSYPVIKLIPNLSIDNLQTVRNFVESGEQVWRHGVLTNEKVAQLGSGETTVIELESK